MKKLSVLMLLVGLFFVGVAVQAGSSCCSASKTKSACAKKASKCAKLTPAQKAAKLQKYGENYKKMAAKMSAKGNTKKAAYYTKLAAAKSKMAEAVKKNDMKSFKKAQAESEKIFKSRDCSKSCKK